MKLLRFILILIFVHAGYVLFNVYPSLPEEMIGKLNGSAHHSDTLSKMHFSFLHLGTLGLLTLLFGLTPGLMKRIPARFWNIPHRDYWLSDNRKATTFSQMEKFMLTLGIATAGFFHFSMYQAILFNLGNTVEKSQINDPPLFFVFFILIWMVVFFYRFGRKPMADQR